MTWASLTFSFCAPVRRHADGQRAWATEATADEGRGPLLQGMLDRRPGREPERACTFTLMAEWVHKAPASRKRRAVEEHGRGEGGRGSEGGGREGGGGGSV